MNATLNVGGVKVRTATARRYVVTAHVMYRGEACDKPDAAAVLYRTDDKAKALARKAREGNEFATRYVRVVQAFDTIEKTEVY